MGFTVGEAPGCGDADGVVVVAVHTSRRAH